jgi:molybdate/tungstate transport system ATP-binding protein
MIELKVRKKLGEFLLDSELKDENFICLVGNNGSGKSSLLNVIAGVYKPDEGYVKVDSKIITDIAPEKRQVVLVTPDSYIPHFSVDRHLLWGAKLQKKQVREETVSEVKKNLEIDFQGRVSQLSLGMKERVSLATALLASPKVILIDEAFANIHNKIQFISSYRELANKSKIDVIYATQHLDDLGCADHAYEMIDGKSKRIR